MIHADQILAKHTLVTSLACTAAAGTAQSRAGHERHRRPRLVQGDRHHAVPGHDPGQHPSSLLLTATASESGHRTGEGLPDRERRGTTSRLVQHRRDLEQAQALPAVLLRNRHAEEVGIGECLPPGCVTIEDVGDDVADRGLGLGGREVHGAPLGGSER